MMSQPPSRNLLKIVLPFLVLLAGAGATAALIASRKTPEPVAQAPVGPLVEVLDLRPMDLMVSVAGQGEVNASTRVDILAEVAGRVVSIHPRLAAGGRLRAGETIAQIDPRDYQLAVESARAAIASTETRLEQEHAEAAAARAEWLDINPDTTPPTLLVRAPQIRQLEAEKAAANAQLAQAELNLERTRIRVPFEAVVLTKNVDRGQFLSQGRTVATLYGTRSVEIRVPLDDAELRWFELPTRSHKPVAHVRADFAGAPRIWHGFVDRLEGQVDPQTRLVHVVVRVEHPFQTQPPLLPGMFVDVAIEGRPLADVFKIPRFALRPGGLVWTLENDTLRTRACDIVRTDRQFAYVRSELDISLSVITSTLDGVTDGMAVRVLDPAGEGDV